MRKHLSVFNFLKYPKEDLFKYLVGLLIVFIPLYPKFPFILVPGSYVSVRLEDFVILACVFLWFLISIKTIDIKKPIGALRSVFEDKITFSFVIFWLVGALSLAAAILITKSVSPSTGILHLFRRFEYMILFFVGYSALRNKKNLMFFLNIFILTFVVAFSVGFLQKYFSFPVITTQNAEYSSGVALRFMPGAHLVSTFAGHYDLSLYILLISSILIGILFVREKSELSSIQKRNNFLLILILCSGMWLLALAASRTIFVSYILSICLLLFWLRKYLIMFLFVVFSFLVLSFSTNLIERYTRIFEVVFPQVQHIKDSILYNPKIIFEVNAASESATLIDTTPAPTAVPVFEDRSTNIRLNASWPRAIRAFTKNPLLGTGYSSITLATDNDFLRLLGEVGILGFLSFITILVVIIKVLIRYVRNEKNNTVEKLFVMGYLCALPGLLLTAVFIDIFEASKFATIFWLISGFCVSIAFRKKINEDIS